VTPETKKAALLKCQIRHEESCEEQRNRWERPEIRYVERSTEKTKQSPPKVKRFGRNNKNDETRMDASYNKNDYTMKFNFDSNILSESPSPSPSPKRKERPRLVLLSVNDTADD
jgi:hypothetical protein